MKANKVLVLLSGGMDSTTLLWKHVVDGDEVRALSVYYGQRHLVELDFAHWQAAAAKVPLVVADLSNLRALLPGSSQTDSSVDVPEGHYAEESMKKTVVPNRNMILLSVAIGHAIAHKCSAVSYAAHAGDHAIYPDCRPEFADVMAKAAKICDWSPVELLRPFIHLTKAEIVKAGHILNVPYHRTWSCYKGSQTGMHCGRCGTCVERREAFHLAGVPDPTDYR